MEKTATLNLRVNPMVKERAEAVLSKLGVPMSTAIDMYLNQISLTGGIPFAITLPKAPETINADLKLDMMPERYRVMDSEPEHMLGLRRMPVDEYSIFYKIQKDKVIVTNILYSASDIEDRLKR